MNSKEIQKSTKVVDQETKLASFGDNYKQQEEYFSSQEYKDKVKNQAKWKAAREFCEDRKLEFKIMTEKELGIR